MIIGISVENVGAVSSFEGALTILLLMTVFPILMAWKASYRSTRQMGERYSGIVQVEGASTTREHSQGLKRVVYLSMLLLIGLVLGIGGIVAQSLMF